MKLQELLSLKEEAIEVKDIADVWEENKDGARIYVNARIFQVKKTTDDDGDTVYEVYSDEEGYRELVGTYKEEDFNATFIPVRKNQKPDAEGFLLYRQEDEVEAFMYEGDTIRVDIDGDKEILRRGDYVIRSEKEDSFVYSIEKARFFEDDYREKK